MQEPVKGRTIFIYENAELNPYAARLDNAQIVTCKDVKDRLILLGLMRDGEIVGIKRHCTNLKPHNYKDNDPLPSGPLTAVVYKNQNSRALSLPSLEYHHNIKRLTGVPKYSSSFPFS